MEDAGLESHPEKSIFEKYLMGYHQILSFL